MKESPPITTQIQRFLERYHLCPKAVDWLNVEGITTLAEAWAKCPRGDWLMWALWRLGKLTKRQSVGLAIKFAARVLPLYEKCHPEDSRPRKAIAAARRRLRHPKRKDTTLLPAATAAARAVLEAPTPVAAFVADAARASADAASATDTFVALASAIAAARASAEAIAFTVRLATATVAAAEQKWQANHIRKMFPKMFASKETI